MSGKIESRFGLSTLNDIKRVRTLGIIVSSKLKRIKFKAGLKSQNIANQIDQFKACPVIDFEGTSERQGQLKKLQDKLKAILEEGKDKERIVDDVLMTYQELKQEVINEENCESEDYDSERDDDSFRDSGPDSDSSSNSS